MIDNKQNIVFWDNVAKKTADRRTAFAGLLFHGGEFDLIDRVHGEQRRFLEIFRPDRGQRVLEVGSGGGRWGFFLADKVREYIGLDISPGMTEAATREARARGVDNVSFVNGMLPDLAVQGKLDLVYFSGVLQYMDDEEVKRCIEKADSLLAEGGCIISRDSVQLSERVEKGGEYPVIYRKESEYMEFFSRRGYRRVYSGLSFEHKRFSGIAGRLYRLPGVTYSLARGIRGILHRCDALLGSPAFLKSAELKKQLAHPNRQEHRFSKYVRNGALP